MTELEFGPWEVFIEGRKEGKGEGWGLGAVVLKRRIREQGLAHSLLFYKWEVGTKVWEGGALHPTRRKIQHSQFSVRSLGCIRKF